ncbi:purine-binding chemotaxis protein CheW [Burkholderia cenocepacia]|uniref:chemotaxis protein CheW n=1 Tax=Burkholderia cepacia complex TaxID=87882 RepID=UPI0004808F9A|nr:MULTISPECIES: chemotaxis protein CheW [Burkholderia cepacia complex]MBR7994918.1 purine-binding chemotaxis protein CheW [Burkholderia cenocepacia]MDN7776295.1 chemotaxis protein CheW [Burkholderia orbicola]HDR9802836.1 purine-binding chemotaxis protein CheW [Burkholderia cenocepacia]HDR9809757.1 purine-binding chemotaxis protein CheW [Burkholderia cenocepacia]HDR9826889.1 purine-binding chemotaxis protein CheW [Burkholderia cenocepacia]
MNRAAAATDDATLDVDDCWNRIGTRGDRSCERLNDCLRCLNCPVYASNAAKLLERPLDVAEMTDVTRRMSAFGTAHASDDDGVARHAALAFRVADEWLALPIGVLREIAGTRPIHSLPHRRNSAVRGVVNIRGTLRIAISIGALLGLDAGKAGSGSDDGRFTRLLVAAHQGEPVVFPVDEVEGVLRFGASDWVPVPATVGRASAGLSRGVLSWRGKSVGLLDDDRLFDAVTRSMR